MSKHMNPTERMELAAQRLTEAGIAAHLRKSKRDVPHIVGDLPRHPETMFSLQFFGRTRTWRVFTPWPGYNQTKADFTAVAEAINYLKDWHE